MDENVMALLMFAIFATFVVFLVVLTKSAKSETRGRDLFWEQIMLDWREREEQRK